MEIILLVLIGVLVAANLIIGLTHRKDSNAEINLELKSKIEVLDHNLSKLDDSIRNEFSRNRDEVNKNNQGTREELKNSLHSFAEVITSNMSSIATLQKEQLETFSKNLSTLTQSNEQKLEKLRESVDAKLTSLQEQINSDAAKNRGELTNVLKSFEDSFKSNVKDFNELQKQKFDSIASEITNLVKSNDQRMEKLRETVEGKLKSIQEDNSLKLEKMRETVDEKLNSTLEKRLGESFKLVSERLEQVHKGLGEMQTLASGVGDLKKVLTNVKARGTLGEIQLESILEQILSPEQYLKNAPTKKNSSERVEFAIKMPGRKDDDSSVLLPVDSKFPIEDYQRLLDAYDIANPVDIEEASKQLENKIKQCAKLIKEKYINPPETTDFGIMFLPIEGLYAEVLRRPGLFETLQRDYKIAITGPTTLAAFLTSLRMGFKTLAIEKRSSEVWTLLGAIKTEFGKFGTILEKTHKKLHEASSNIELATQRTRQIERKLRSVQELPTQDALNLLGSGDDIESA